jgi:hypothetical protein
MFIMSKKYVLFPIVLSLNFHNDDRYIDILLSNTCSQAAIAQSVRRRIFDPEVWGSYPVGARIFAFLPFLFFCTLKCSVILL